MSPLALLERQAEEDLSVPGQENLGSHSYWMFDS